MDAQTARVGTVSARLDVKGRGEMRKAQLLDRNPSAVEAVLAAAQAFASMCRFHGVAPASVHPNRVFGKMKISTEAARIVIEVS